MGNMNPMLERRGTIGYAFSQDVANSEAEQEVLKNSTKMEISPPISPLAD